MGDLLLPLLSPLLSGCHPRRGSSVAVVVYRCLFIFQKTKTLVILSEVAHGTL
jgi:hypothetical protein